MGYKCSIVTLGGLFEPNHFFVVVVCPVSYEYELWQSHVEIESVVCMF